MRDLLEAYRAKSDDELLTLAKEIESLTPDARLLLRSELLRRGLKDGSDDRSDPLVTLSTEDDRSLFLTPAKYGSPTPQLLATVIKIYHLHFWFLLRLMIPAAMGTLVFILARSEASEIGRHVARFSGNMSNLRDSFPSLLLVQLGLLNYGGGFVSWVASCVSFAGICSAVNQLSDRGVPVPENCFRGIREHLPGFLGISIALFSMLAGIMLVWVTVLFIAGSWIYAHGISFSVIAYAVTALGCLLLSRFGLAIPAVVLDGCSVVQSLFRSDELTQGKWLTLAALLTKSLAGGYIAAMAPYWVAGWIWRFVHIPSAILTALSFTGVTVVEPFMLIGFSLMYLEGRAKTLATAPS